MAGIRAALAPPHAESARNGDDDGRPAAVLVPLIDRPDGPSMLFTRRTAHLAHHAGQVSFPGGRMEPGDPDAVACALRETAEETGLAPEAVEVLGVMAPKSTRTGFVITPVVGILSPPLALRPDPMEVAEVFEVPLEFLMDPANHRRVTRVVDGRERDSWAMPYREHYIWGATAGIIRRLWALAAS